MTLDEVNKRVEAIRVMAGDDEVAHSAEDALHQDLLLAIANDKCENPADCAAAALKTQDIEFSRWCA